MTILKMTDLDLRDKRVLVREDFNVPLKDGVILDNTRIRAAIPGIRHALASKARLMLASHLGRPAEGVIDETDSLASVAKELSKLLGIKVPLKRNWLDGVDVNPGQVVLLENCRFNVGEKKNDDKLARKMAALCDIFVMDAFGTAHRSEASTQGVAKFAKIACAGPLLVSELEALSCAIEHPKRPLVAIVGGSKVSTKLTTLKALAQKVDQLIVAGGIANTFLLAQGYKIGKSLAEPEFVDQAKEIMHLCSKRGGKVPLPVDVVCATEISENAIAALKPAGAVQDGEMILDIGPKSSDTLAQIVAKAGTIIWNGPIGVFEYNQFSHGTEKLARAVAASNAYSLVGGGETLAAIAKYGLAEKISYLSTGGGAFLEFLEGKKLPAVEILEQRAGQPKAFTEK